MRRALIIGGGIAGPVAAIALQRVGIESTIYEAHAESADPPGAFLTVAVNGLDALKSLDLHRTVMEAGFPSRAISFVSGNGKRLGRVPIGGELQDGTVTHTLKRADLYRILKGEAARRGIVIEHGKRLADAEPGNGGVVAQFEDGSEAAGDLLIGADGIHSRTRRIIDPNAPGPRYTGLGNIGGFTRVAGVAIEPGAYVMMFGRRAFFGYTVSSSGEIWWFANPPGHEALTGVRLTTIGTELWKARLITYFAEDAGPAVEIIHSTPLIQGGTNQYDLPSVPRWWRGPMIIIGDAAHAASPSSGQGASMAIEDAVVLARCLRDLPDPGSGFAAFEQLRRARVERVVAFGARGARGKAPGPIARVVRDLVLPMILKRFAVASQDWLFRYHIDWEARIDVTVQAA